jgi:hypothetical protein
MTVIVDTMKELTLWHQLRWVKDHQDDKDLIMDDGDVKPLKEGFFTDLMEVGILVDGVKVTSHLVHQI